MDNELLRQCKDEVAKSLNIWKDWNDLADCHYWDGDARGMHDEMVKVAELYASKLREDDHEKIKELESQIESDWYVKHINQSLNADLKELKNKTAQSHAALLSFYNSMIVRLYEPELQELRSILQSLNL